MRYPPRRVERVVAAARAPAVAPVQRSGRVETARVARALSQTVRASSVVECMNSVIRMHQARHRTLTQPLLDLKRLAWNCRSFAEGKRRGRSPYEHLGLKLPTYDFWELLQKDPAELEQEVSSQQLAI